MAKGQPKALYLLFMTELWERFGFYTLVSIFAFYLTDRLDLPSDRAFLIFSTYVSFAYLVTVGGGILADKALGFGRAILLGALLIAGGYLVLGLADPHWVYWAMGLLAAGNGLFKANVAALLGRFYDEEDPRRGAGFTLFYMGINIGVLAGSLFAGMIAQAYSYEAAFIVAGTGKLIAVATYLAGRRLVSMHDGPPPGLKRPMLSQGLAIGAVLLSAVVGALLLRNQAWTAWILGAFGFLVVVAYLAVILRQEGQVRRRLLVHLALLFFAMIFWAIYQQYTLSVLLYAQQDVDRSLFGWVLPSSSTTALGAMALLLLWPLLTLLWPWLSKRGFHLGDLGKLALSLVGLGLGYLLLAVVVEVTDEAGKASMIWIVGFYGFLGFGEILLAPLGLALTARLAPQHLAGYAVGMWSFSFAAAVYLAGVLAVPQQITGESAFGGWFLGYGIAGLATALLVVALLPRLSRLLGAR